jgi:ABC-type molybdate transport system ATPase subunit
MGDGPDRPIRDAFALPVLLVSHQQDEVARLADAVVSSRQPLCWALRQAQGERK